MGDKRLSKKELTSLLGLGKDGGQRDGWLRSRRVTQRWEEFCEHYKCTSSKSPVSMTVVSKAVDIFNSKQHGAQFWERRPDKSRWGEEDHNIMFIVQAVDANRKHGQI
jgi:hypothetical protein